MFLRRTKIQLAVFAVLTAVALAIVSVNYLDLPRLLGFNQYPVSVRFTDATGLYESGLVTYRGVTVGRIKQVRLDGDYGVAELAINDDVRLPADIDAEAHSTSAAGEQFIELLPRRDGEPYLRPGDVIAADRATALPSTHELLDNLHDLAASVPAEQLDTMLTEVTAAFQRGSGDWQELLTSARTLIDEAAANIEPTTQLLDRLGPFLDSQHQQAGAWRSALRDLASFTGALKDADSDVRSLLSRTPPAVDAMTGLTADLAPDLSVLLADLSTTGQVVKTYLPGVEQSLVLYPAVTAALQSAMLGPGADPGTVHLEMRPNVGQPPNCLEGFLPINEQRDFSDETPRKNIPDNLHCRVPHDDPRAVRGARNTPCLNAPGRRAASVEECLGAKPGTVDDPVPNAGPRVGTYDARSGRVLAPDGSLYLLGGVGSQAEGEEVTSWQQLLLK